MLVEKYGNYNVSDKLICKQDRWDHINTELIFSKDQMYEITQIDIGTNAVKIYLLGNDAKENHYFFSLLNDRFYLLEDYFTTLKEERRKKLNKICHLPIE